MVLTIHGMTRSMSTRRVAVVAVELGIPYKLVEVDLPNGEHKSEEFLKTKHAFGRIPIIDDDGFQLTGLSISGYAR